MSEISSLDDIDNMTGVPQMNQMATMGNTGTMETAENLGSVENMDGVGKMENIQNMAAIQHMHQLQHMQHMQHMHHMQQLHGAQDDSNDALGGGTGQNLQHGAFLRQMGDPGMEHGVQLGGGLGDDGEEQEDDQDLEDAEEVDIADYDDGLDEDASEPSGAFANVGQGLVGKYKNYMMQYWQNTIDSIERDEHDFKNHQLPLARIKKVMKTDEEVKMISAEAPILFAKGCDIFITELTMRAWIHAEENKRRTLQKSDIAAALQKSDMFDFLIDIVPREEEKTKKKNNAGITNPMTESSHEQHQQHQLSDEQLYRQYQQQQQQQQQQQVYYEQQYEDRSDPDNVPGLEHPTDGYNYQ